jgi:2-hydroxycyclohexanecarboxyl-CoA dehydrogenase
MTGRVAFVCAPGAGAGHAVAETLAARGAKVALAVRDGDGTWAGVAPGVDRAEMLTIDVRQPASVQAAVTLARSACGPIDILVNCVGAPTERAFLDTDETDWRALTQVSLMGVSRVTQAVLPEMIERGFGRVVNVASDAGRVGGVRQAISAGCGGGVIAFTKTIARELARHSITANTVCYGATEELAANATSAGDAEARARAVPLKRFGQPSELAAAVAFLVSDEAGFITGQTLSVNGGTSMV